MSASGHENERWVRACGLLLAVVGALALFPFPLLKVHATTGGSGMNLFQSFVQRAWRGTLLGGVVLVWGASTASTGRWRSLTPVRATAASGAVAVPWVLAGLVPTTTVEGPLAWDPPSTVVEAFRETVVPTGGRYVAVGFVVAVGVAVARERRTEVEIASGSLIAFAALTGLVANDFLNQAGGVVFWAALYGVVAAPFGYLAAAPR